MADSEKDSEGDASEKQEENIMKEEDRLLRIFEKLSTEREEDLLQKEDHLSDNHFFNGGVCALILINAFMIGYEVDYGRGDLIGQRIPFFVLDLLFCLCFFIEVLVRQNFFTRPSEAKQSFWALVGWEFFDDPWNVFDYVLVVLSCSTLIASLGERGSVGCKLVAALRLVRLLRVVRAIKGRRSVRELWFIVQGMLDSLSTLAWVGLLLLIIVYCVGVVLTNTVGHNERAEEYWQYAPQYVGTVQRSMWTVVQVITFDAWASDVARPMQEASPGSVWILLGAIVVCSFGVLNVIVAVMVQHTRSLAMENTGHVGSVLEEKDQELLKSMAEEFSGADVRGKEGDSDSDEEGDQELDFDEFRELLKSESFGFKLRLLGVRADEAESLFDLMDADKSGTVSHKEFIMGLQKMKGTAKGQDLVQLIGFANRQCLRATKFVEKVQKLNDKADIIQKRLNTMGRAMSEELKERKTASRRVDDVWKRAKKRQGVITQLDEDRKVTFPGLKKPGER